ncbi:tigger transposable element-derived protein 1-like [Palaemon carinicauda]|uniref:tigger transposable element-derived protein 1-like n=1 Tax=Palaemon carinicauda TaxID=392227 RepID=UPI0035B5AB74
MIRTILKQKEAIKAATPKGVTVFSSKWSHVHDEMERLLLVWIKDREMAGDTITEAIICQKASTIFGDLMFAQAEADAGEGTSKKEPPEFKASPGWFEKFKRRSSIHSVVRHRETASSPTKAAKAFVKMFDELTVREGYSPQQVFNCDETEIFWNKNASSNVHHGRRKEATWA